MSEHSRWEMSPKRIFWKHFYQIKFTFQTLQTNIFWTLSWPFSCDYNFWLRDLKFGMCIKDPINKTCWKMVKICQTGLLKLNFETRPKKRIFWFLPKISAGHAWSWKFFFANFQILGCQGWVVIPQNVKKSQNHCTLLFNHTVFRIGLTQYRPSTNSYTDFFLKIYYCTHLPGWV